MALETKEQRPALPKGQFMQVFLLVFAVTLVLYAPLRAMVAKYVGIVLNPVIGFGGRYPILTILLASLIMIGASTFIRHWLVDWVKMARVQNVMRSYQKAMREARVSKDAQKIERLTKFQTKFLPMQAELSTGQMKPMAGTMIVVIPIFAWLLEFITAQPYHYFSAPWNPQVNMFTTEGILLGSSLFPHWILFYSAISIPFGTLLGKTLKYWTWREHWHLIGPGMSVSSAENAKDFPPVR